MKNKKIIFVLAATMLLTACGAKTDPVESSEPAASSQAETVSSKEDDATSSVSTHEHSWNTEWSKDETGHWKTCSGCNETSEKAAHTWDEGKVTTAATCTVDGVKTFTCTVCGYEKTETIDALGHDWSDTYSSDEDYHWHTCTRDGCVADSEQEDHKWDKGVVTTPATYTTDGEMTYTCTVCGRTRTESIEKLKSDSSVTVTLGEHVTNDTYIALKQGTEYTAITNATIWLYAEGEQIVVQPTFEEGYECNKVLIDGTEAEYVENAAQNKAGYVATLTKNGAHTVEVTAKTDFTESESGDGEVENW